MIPAKYDIKIYRGDTYYGPLITLPDLSPFGGPSSLADPVEVRAQIRTPDKVAKLIATINIEVVDPVARTVRPTMAPSVTGAIADREADWDLEVDEDPDTPDSWVGTPLAGKAAFSGDVTKDE